MEDMNGVLNFRCLNANFTNYGNEVTVTIKTHYSIIVESGSKNYSEDLTFATHTALEYSYLGEEFLITLWDRLEDKEDESSDTDTDMNNGQIWGSLGKNMEHLVRNEAAPILDVGVGSETIARSLYDKRPAMTPVWHSPELKDEKPIFNCGRIIHPNNIQVVRKELNRMLKAIILTSDDS